MSDLSRRPPSPAASPQLRLPNSISDPSPPGPGFLRRSLSFGKAAVVPDGPGVVSSSRFKGRTLRCVLLVVVDLGDVDDRPSLRVELQRREELIDGKGRNRPRTAPECPEELGRGFVVVDVRKRVSVVVEPEYVPRYLDIGANDTFREPAPFAPVVSLPHTRVAPLNVQTAPPYE